MNLSFRDLEACLAVAELRNFRRAAERCHLSQSAFSTRVAAIEQALGARLFDRTTRAVELTKEGALFIESARRLVGDFTELVEDFQQHTSRRKGRVAIAALPSIASAWLPAVFADFQASHPGITLTLHDVVSDACIVRLREGSVDFAVASRPPEGEEMEARLLSEDNFYLVCRRDHPLSSKAGLKARDLAEHPFIALSRDSSVRQNLEKAFHPVKLRNVMQLEHLATVAGMVQAGLGITVVPELTLFQFTRPGLVVRPLKIPRLSRSIYVVRRRGKTLSVAATALYDHMMAERAKIHDYLRMQLGAAAV
jgi:DNA-binding transcriptional LysR family regulator